MAAGHCASSRGLRRSTVGYRAAPLWTFSSTRASSSSPATASPCPTGAPATTVDEAVAAADEIGYPCVVKAQVQIGGRGKAGGIKVAKDRDEAEEHAKAILGMDIRGLTVHEVWIEEASDIAAEYYASIVFDRAAKTPARDALHAGRHGHRGGRRATTRTRSPACTSTRCSASRTSTRRRLAFEAGVDADVVRPVGALLAKLYDAFVAEEAMLVEVNPLIVTGDREVDGARREGHARRQRALPPPRQRRRCATPRAEDPQEQMAHERGLTYVKLDGDIGILGNGAGLVMSHARRRRPGRRRARELPRRRRRLEGRGDHAARSR